MDNQKVARELVHLAKSLIARRMRVFVFPDGDIIKQGGETDWQAAARLTHSFSKEPHYAVSRSARNAEKTVLSSFRYWVESFLMNHPHAVTIDGVGWKRDQGRNRYSLKHNQVLIRKVLDGAKIIVTEDFHDE